jgi:hypothetical protein
LYKFWVAKMLNKFGSLRYLKVKDLF